jgi:two-component system cell cycle response regulator
MRPVVLITASERREVLAERLRMQGYAVRSTGSSAEGVHIALAEPPAAVVADLWMPVISGVQLCRLLRSEASTENVPVILVGPEQGQRHRFWAEKAGASAYVGTGRMGDLVRALERAISVARPSDFFTHLAEHIDVRDRMAAHLDQALFDSVLASEVRALSACAEFERFFDLFSQLVARITSYRWLAVSTHGPRRLGLHVHPLRRAELEHEARLRLALGADAPAIVVEDEDASDDEQGPAAIVAPILFGHQELGRLALAPRAPVHPKDADFVRTLAGELGGPLRIVSLVEESQRLAAVDPLTGVRNRRSLLEALGPELARTSCQGAAMSLLLLDVDHFKAINDRHGHAAGDVVLAGLGALLRRELRGVDLIGRWGGEEFVVALPERTLDDAARVAERLRQHIAALSLDDPRGERLSVTASIGVAEQLPGEDLQALIDRADRAMYAAKSQGRDRVVVSSPSALHAVA